MTEDNEEVVNDRDDDNSSTLQNTEDNETQPDGILGDDDDTIVDIPSLNMSSSN